MTDQVDTDALLRSIRTLVDRYLTAADEVDRLRSELAKSILDSREATKTAQFERERAEGYEREMNGLTAIFENAPHDSGCQFSFLPEDKQRRCTCWKAEAL